MQGLGTAAYFVPDRARRAVMAWRPHDASASTRSSRRRRGSTTLMCRGSAARYLSRQSQRDHPVEFVLFDQEEVGLLGSAANAASLRAEGVAVHSMHGVDMLSFDGHGDRAVELWLPSIGP